MRREGTRWILESPLAPVRIELSDPAGLRLLGALAAPGSSGSIAKLAGVSRETARAALSLLDAGGLLTRAERHGTREDADPGLAVWEFADLLLHARSRLGFHTLPMGAQFPFQGRLAPLPPLKPPRRGARIPLPRPGRNGVARHRAFTEVLEQRRSSRDFSGPPLTRAELGEFLYRAARVRRLRTRRNGRYAASERPYPSGGACYPLELYLAAGRCEGLRPGLYHYDPLGHRLTRYPRSVAASRQLLADARQAVGARRTPQALFVCTARFARVAWKYRSMAYATVLKDVGVLFQTLYLVATAQGLAGCAAGCGDAALLARIIGTPFYEESSVGEFLLGRGRERAKP